MSTSSPQPPATALPPAPIVPVGEDRRSEALRRLTAASADGGQSRRFEAYARRHQIDLSAMWAIVDERGRFTASALAVANPGRTAMLFATPPACDGQVQPIGALIDHACAMLARTRADQVHLAQVLVEPGDHLEQRAFRAGGFHELARLSYLERPLPGPRITEVPPWPADCRVHPYRPEDRQVVLEILEASYRQTLDCPGLLGLRRTEDILAGHLGTGDFDPQLWTILHAGDRPAGVLLLNPSNQTRCVELVYLGLAPFARGRGLGSALLHHGLHQLQHRRRERMVMLAVDEGNLPALRLYEREGFRRVLRRVALIRPIGG